MALSGFEAAPCTMRALVFILKGVPAEDMQPAFIQFLWEEMSDIAMPVFMEHAIYYSKYCNQIPNTIQAL